MQEGRDHAVGVDREVFGLELISLEEIAPVVLEDLALGVKDLADALAACGLRRVVEHEFRHLVSSR
jgi:hypothetical protein